MNNNCFDTTPVALSTSYSSICNCSNNSDYAVNINYADLCCSNVNHFKDEEFHQETKMEEVKEFISYKLQPLKLYYKDFPAKLKREIYISAPGCLDHTFGTEWINKDQILYLHGNLFFNLDSDEEPIKKTIKIDYDTYESYNVKYEDGVFTITLNEKVNPRPDFKFNFEDEDEDDEEKE